MQFRDAAERVLFADSLEEKLSPAPIDAGDDSRGVALETPDAPGRPDHLQIAAKGSRTQSPSLTKIDDERERGVLLHFMANHELLAAELMALNLLKFPDAPAGYRAGVYKAMREEQAHARMYLKRMAECGVEFGSLPLNGYFWRLIAGVETPMDFVARLNLTFEQANLDFSKHYAAMFREAGDPATAKVLEKIYLDEIGHVGHGVKWFRKWKDEGDSDWRAFGKALAFPLAPAKAKGIAPFNPDGRRRAGLDEEFIRQLEVCEQSRGRTPVLHWFNPNAETHARGVAKSLGKFERALERDLEMVMLAPCRRDDILLVRDKPSPEHLASLQAAGFDLPEIATQDELAGRKLGGLRPWAWSPDGSEALRPVADQVSENMPDRWREPVPPGWLSKELGPQLEAALGLDSGARLLEDAAPAPGVLFKSLHACAGRGHMRGDADGAGEWLRATLDRDGAVVSEPLLERVADFSAQYEMGESGARLLGMARVENDSSGRFRGIDVAPTWSRLLPPEVAEFLHRDAEVTAWYRDRIPAALPGLMPGYRGAVGVDAMVHRTEGGGLALRHVVEVNVRYTMGRIALELLRRFPQTPGQFRIARKGKWDGEGVALNDPSSAAAFIATWSSGAASRGTLSPAAP